MLVVDSSAIIAMLFEEPEGRDCAAALGASSRRVISAANYVETGTVLAGRLNLEQREQAATDLDVFLSTFRIEISPINAELARAALAARLRFGKGFGSRRGLNFGDSFAYALAKSFGAPLLFIGNDFAVTDIESAIV
jgi:ribonuclease VapC